jgi:hypothetical protein
VPHSQAGIVSQSSGLDHRAGHLVSMTTDEKVQRMTASAR